MVRCGRPLTAVQLAAFDAEVLILESQVPASLRCLVRQCENELNEVDGNIGDIKPKSFWERH